MPCGGAARRVKGGERETCETRKGLSFSRRRKPKRKGFRGFRAPLTPVPGRANAQPRARGRARAGGSSEDGARGGGGKRNPKGSSFSRRRSRREKVFATLAQARRASEVRNAQASHEGVDPKRSNGGRIKRRDKEVHERRPAAPIAIECRRVDGKDLARYWREVGTMPARGRNEAGKPGQAFRHRHAAPRSGSADAASRTPTIERQYGRSAFAGAHGRQKSGAAPIASPAGSEPAGEAGAPPRKGVQGET